MTHLKKIIMTTAILAMPAMAFAQVSTDVVVDKVKDKAVDTVIDNMTADDAIVAGKTMIKGGSKEDAAKAVVKNRVDDKVEDVKDSVSVGDVSLGDAADVDMSKDGMMDAGKDMAKDAAKDEMMDEAKTHSSATKYSDKVPSSARTYGSAIIHKSGMPAPTPAPAATTTTPAASTPLMAPVNCPSGTTAQPDGTCMITGNWAG